jgi:hypothetical protein
MAGGRFAQDCASLRLAAGGCKFSKIRHTAAAEFVVPRSMPNTQPPAAADAAAAVRAAWRRGGRASCDAGRCLLPLLLCHDLHVCAHVAL